MERPAENLKTVQFGLFQVDLLARELRKSGVKIKLHDQPFQVLTVLLERPGQIVTRGELHSRLWPSDTFVDFDLSLNSAVKKLRHALGDESDNPRFVETLYRRGYRFIAPVVGVPPQNGGSVDTRSAPSEETAGKNSDQRAPVEVAPPPPIRRGIWLAVGAVALFLLAALLYTWLPRPTPRVLRIAQITSGGNLHQMSALATDGRRLYFQAVDQDRLAVAEVSVEGGDSSLIPTPFQNTMLAGIAPDGSSLFITSFEGTAKEGPAWFLPLPAGSPRSLATTVTAHSEVFTPDSQYLLFAHEEEIYEAKPNGADTRKLATLGGYVDDLQISPDGRKLRACVTDVKTATSTLWELDRNGSHLHPLLPDWNPLPRECCGRWTPDGKYYLFSSVRDGRSSLWALPERHWPLHAKPQPVQLTFGPLDFTIPVPSKDGKKIFAIGGLARCEVLRFNGTSFVPYFKNASATDLGFSADGQRLAYISVPEGALWSSKLDGSSRIQLTDAAAIQAALPRWSPDGSQIAFMGRTPNADWRAYIISADGHGLRELIPGAAAGIDPNWSPDGRSIVFAANDLGPVSNNISILDLQTHKLTPVPGGENLFSPRWSPDGRYIVGITTDSGALVLFDRTSQKWSELVRMGIGFPSWSHDGQYIY
ncbi:MAG: winged helix-turn-helix domain-containing protein, partial [Terriglobales bacterium]